MNDTDIAVHPRLTNPSHRTFVRELARTGSPTQAAAAAGLDRSSLYKTRRTNPILDEAWSDALEQYADSLEAAARLRAVDGVDEPVFHQGIEVGAVRKYSDTLLGLLLKGNRPEKFDRRQFEVTGAGGGPLQIEESPNAIARKIAFALAVGLRAQAIDGTAERAPDASEQDGLDLV